MRAGAGPAREAGRIIDHASGTGKRERAALGEVMRAVRRGG